VSADPLQGVVIALGSDHAGFALKQIVLTHLEERGAVTMDLGKN
jgi:ribose 5-phosphate isomerase RpiB